MTRLFLILALLVPVVASATDWLGDVPVGETLNFNFNTLGSDGAPITIAGTPAIEVYEDGGTTQITAGTTLTEDFDSVTGLHNIAIVATGANGFEAGKYYSVVIAGTTPTADSVSILGRVVARFRCVAAENTAGTPVADSVSLSGSSTAADNAEVVFDTDFATAYSTTNDKWQTEADVLSIEGTAASTSLASAADIVDEWESQSQADPTGFHVNVLEIGGTAQTANDNGADINAILADTANMQPKLGTFTTTAAGDIQALQTNVLDKMLGYTQLTLRKDAAIATDRATELNEINSDEGSGAGAYAQTTDSQQALVDGLPTNFGSLVISGSGAVDSLLQGFLNNTIAESSADNIAGNFETFWDNGDAATANTVDDVGGSGLDAAGVRAALGMASADLDDQLDALPTTAEIEAEITDRLPTATTKTNLDTAFGSTLAEVSGVPQANDPLWEKVGFLFQALTAGYENDKATASGAEKRYKNAAGTVQWEKPINSDGTTYTESAGEAPD